MNSGYNDKFSFSPDQNGKGGNVGDDAQDKYYPEYEAGIPEGNTELVFMIKYMYVSK